MRFVRKGVRFGEIDTNAKSAADRQDRGSLQKLCDELTQGEWCGPPTKALVQSVRKLTDDVTRQSARKDLESLEVEMNAAFSALDLAHCRALRQRCNELTGQARLDPGVTPCSKSSAPALGWLADEDEKDVRELAFKRAVSALERKLADGSADAEDLRKAGHAVLKCDRKIPEPLATRYQSRIHALESATQVHYNDSSSVRRRRVRDRGGRSDGIDYRQHGSRGCCRQTGCRFRHSVDQRQ